MAADPKDLPALPERNSEKSVITFAGVAVFVLTLLGMVAGAVLDAGFVDSIPWAVALLGAVVSMAKMASSYTESRPQKHIAMIERERMEIEKKSLGE